MRCQHHWEYRVFGNLQKKIKRYIRGRQSASVISSTLCDEYLWAPGCTANIKANIKLRQHGNQSIIKILKPVPIQTMCVEGVDCKRSQPGNGLAGLRQFMKEVDLPRSLEVMGYLQFIGRHAASHV